MMQAISKYYWRTCCLPINLHSIRRRQIESIRRRTLSQVLAALGIARTFHASASWRFFCLSQWLCLPHAHPEHSVINHFSVAAEYRRQPGVSPCDAVLRKARAWPFASLPVRKTGRGDALAETRSMKHAA
ncbi:hypothetical protein [Paraburkholderia sp. BCC1885]|uniref:hypothetical protein n=1 Tax=Paraburkholderia sp. BCC1885 TaxID=2562669 RepID=UPI001182C78E|nr:hypothetical protein [Paraburkholderia sp. BCC1885]